MCIIILLYSYFVTSSHRNFSIPIIVLLIVGADNIKREDRGREGERENESVDIVHVKAIVLSTFSYCTINIPHTHTNKKPGARY